MQQITFKTQSDLDSFLRVHQLSIAPTLTIDSSKKSDPARRLHLMCPNPEGLVVANLKERTITVVNSGYGDAESASKLKDMKAFDPTNRLLKLVAEKKIDKIQGNANIEEAQVILLPDFSHPDKTHSRNRGEIANAVRNNCNIFLCEGVDSDRWELSLQEKQYYLPQGLELNHFGDEVYGWDNSHFHRTGLEKVKNILGGLNAEDIKVMEEALHSGDISSVLSNFDMVMKLASTADTIENDRSSIDNSVDIRTENLINVILNKMKSANGSRIIVEGGAGHLLDPVLLKALGKNNVKFCAISAATELSFSSLSEGTKIVQGYYKK